MFQIVNKGGKMKVDIYNTDKKYNIIYADPPWNFKTYSEKGKQKKSAECHYRCMNIDNYTKCKISYFFFKYNEDNEEYNQQIDDIQDVFQIDSNKILILEYLTTIFKKMYNDFLKTRYSGDIMFNTDDTVLEIYSRIQEKFPNRFVKESVLNYVRSELKKKYGLNNTNTEIVIGYLENIIKDQK